MEGKQAMADFVFASTYARYRGDIGRRETFHEAVERMRSMHKIRYAGHLSETSALETLVDDAFDAVQRKEVLASQRALQFGGEPVLRKNMRLYNCATSYCDRPRFFAEALYMGLCGAGVGFSVQTCHTEKLPPLISLAHHNSGDEVYYTVEDSIEGWADAVNTLINYYFGVGALPLFNFSEIRPRGTPIAAGGTAPGPEPLENALEKIDDLLCGLVEEGVHKLRPIHCFDIAMFASEAVISGGRRRAATIALFDRDDEEMLNAKTGNWFEENKQRSLANISAVQVIGEESREDFTRVVASARQYGEPGVIFTRSRQYVYNPCVAPDTLVLTDRGYRRIDRLEQATLQLDPRFGKGSRGDTTERGGYLTSDERQLYRLQTKEGYWVECTEEHQIMTQRGWVPACELTLGDSVHIGNVRHHGGFGGLFTEAQGAVLGWLLGDGCVVSATQGRLYFYGDKEALAPMFAELLGDALQNTTKQEGRTYLDFSLSFLADIKSGWSTETKRFLPDGFFEGSSEFLVAFLRSLFTADGSVQGDASKGLSVRLTQNDLPLLDAVQRVLLQLGVFSKLYRERRPAGDYLMPDGKGGEKYYTAKAVHELMVSRDSLNVFSDDIGFWDHKQQVLKARLAERTRRPYADRFVAKFESLEPTRKSPVYDLTQPDTSSFIANGIVVHNCVEIGMCPVLITDPEGLIENRYTLDMLNNPERYIERGYTYQSGWQTCNLTEINGAAIKSAEDLVRAAQHAAVIGTLQAGYTEPGYLEHVTQRILEREALVGVSITGIMDSPDLLLDPNVLERGAQAVVQMNRRVSAMLGINSAARTTCVKPAGTTSILLGTASGIHPHFGRRVIRHIQMNKDNPVIQLFKQHNPSLVEESEWSANGTDYVVAFPIECDADAVVKGDLSAVEFLDHVRLVQRAWVEAGTARPCSAEQLRHNVSNTCAVREDEWGHVEEYLWSHRDALTGVAMLGDMGELCYPQLPNQTVLSLAQYRERFGDEAADCVAQGELPVDVSPPVDEGTEAMIYHARGILKFERLKRDLVAVPYEGWREASDVTNPTADGACSGQSCEVTYL